MNADISINAFEIKDSRYRTDSTADQLKLNPLASELFSKSITLGQSQRPVGAGRGLSGVGVPGRNSCQRAPTISVTTCGQSVA